MGSLLVNGPYPGIAPNGYYIHYTSINSNPYPYPYVRQFMQCLTFRPLFAETASITAGLRDTVVSQNPKVGSVFRVNSKSGSHVHSLRAKLITGSLY